MRIGPTFTTSLVIFSVFQVCSVLTFIFFLFMKFLGSTIAVECIFSSGWDTISLCHTSLQPDTIRTLMVLKHRLHRMHVNEGGVITVE